MILSTDLPDGLQRLSQWKKVAVCTICEGSRLPEPFEHQARGQRRVHVEFVTPRYEVAAIFNYDDKFMFCFLVKTLSVCW